MSADGFFRNVLMNGINEMIFIIRVGKNGGFYYDFLNHAAKKRTMLTEDTIGQSIQDVNPKETADFLTEKYRRVIETRDLVNYEDSYTSLSGIKYFETTLSPHYESNAAITHIIALVKDITKQKQNELEIHKSEMELKRNKLGYQLKNKPSEDHFRIIAENSNDLITMVNSRETIDYVSPSYHDVLGYDFNEYTGKHFLHHVHSDDEERVHNSFLHAVRTQTTWKEQFRQKHGNGHYIWCELRGSPVYDEYGEFKHMVVLSRNITLRKDYETQLRYMAYHDPLTGLPNRRYFIKHFTDYLKSIKNTEKRLSIIMMDLDQFKMINDRMGHDIGDKVIQEFGNRISRIIRKEDILARLGGDEFILMLPDIVSTEDAQKAGERIIRTLDGVWRVDDYEFQTTTSLGIVISSAGSAESARVILNCADEQLYKAKQAGKNNYKLCNFDYLNAQ
ncbi:sensor domain-containing protein [Lentibacillus cibarius]|uniref:sensor domain-containing protein n=1 Tax=Lentibacillus cibarius TaxID=2583219 RepID=UPI001487422B|nr:diguanylate cyclase [Lentibacillus cibarius]